MTPIFTKWHKAMEAAAAGRISCLLLDKNGNSIEFEDGLFNKVEFHHFMEKFQIVPRFVISSEILDLLNTNQSAFSISDMITCNVIGVPFKKCVFEFTVNKVVYNICIDELNGDSADTKRWVCSALAYNALSDKDYVMSFPCFVEFALQSSHDEPFDTDVASPIVPKINYSFGFESFISAEYRSNEVMDDSYPLIMARCFTGLVAAMLLPQTIGLQKQEIVCKDSFNLTRKRKGKAEIPSYTLIRIDQDRIGISKQGTHRGLAVHLRRAHKKRVAFGAGRTQREWRFIPAQIVGFLPDGSKPTMPEMLATRAAKPYLLT